MYASCSHGSKIQTDSAGITALEIPAGENSSYRIAQLDNTTGLTRPKFSHRPPLRFSVNARTHFEQHQGTWGFGFWNDPFSFSLGFGGGTRRLPVLPNATWFFFASNENYLTLKDNQPGNGLMVMSWRSPTVPSIILGLGAPILPLLIHRPINQYFRRIASHIIQHEVMALMINQQDWHHYQIDWLEQKVIFSIDNQFTMETSVSPRPPLGLVIWIDNQYATLHPSKGVGFGILPTPVPRKIEFSNLLIKPQ